MKLSFNKETEIEQRKSKLLLWLSVLFRGENAVKSFVFNPIYGNEGSLLTTVVLIVSIAVLFLLIKMKAKKGTDPLTEKMVER